MNNNSVRFIKISFFLVVAFLLTACHQNQLIKQHPEIDLLIKNANILDGKGGDTFSGNIYVNKDQIFYVGKEKIKHLRVKRVINARGKFVSPGFIDLHSHGDPKTTPKFENFVAMGVTTITLGQDGASPEIINLKNWQNEVIKQGLGLNIAMFVGHGTLRNLANVGTRVKADSLEMNKTKEILDQNLDFCFGMSTGLEYAPGLYAEENELIELAKVVGVNNRMIMSHMRNEDDDQLINSIQELIRQGEWAKVHISHFKSVYGKGKERAEEILRIIHQARSEGVNITADMYPYIASYTGIAIVFPDWSKTKEQFKVVKNTRRDELETFIRKKVNSRNGPQATLFGTKPYTGKTLADLEKEFGKPFEKILIDDIGPGNASAAYFVMNDELQSRFLTDSIVSFCSDGSAIGYHPRGHGTFARIIEEFVMKRKVLTLEEAIRKMTSYAADILGIYDRGRIEIGKKADLIIFSPDKVKANADFSNPFQLAEGFDIVIINGKIAREKGVMNKTLSGKFLIPAQNLNK